MPLIRVGFIAVLFTLAVAAPASAGTAFVAGGDVAFQAGANADVNHVTVTRVSGDTFTVVDTVIPVMADTLNGCVQTNDNTATCTSTGHRVFVYAQGGDDEIVVLGVAEGTILSGGDGDDDITGTEGYDSISGDEGNDEIDGLGGDDEIDIGGSSSPGAGADTIDGGEGSDVIMLFGVGDVVRDTGAGAGAGDWLRTDYIDAAVTVRVNNGQADDGATGVGGSTVLAGFEKISGDGFADVLVGSSASETLTGYDGNDKLTGGTGADLLEGGNGDDELTLSDGIPDLASDCGDGTADIAHVDASGDATTGCETIDNVAAPVEETPPPTTTTPATTTTPTTTTPADGGTTSAVQVVGQGTSTKISVMPKVAGFDLGKARRVVEGAVPNVDIALVFSRKCTEKQTLDVIKQSPAAGQSITTSEFEIARVALDVCVPDKRFLTDCDRKDLAADLKQLPDGNNAGVGTELLLRLARCKTDVDVKLMPPTAPASAPPRIGFDDVKGKGGKGAIEATLRCGRTKHDFAVALGEGLQSGTTGDVSFSLSERGGKWVLPSNPRDPFKSVVEIQVQSRTAALTASEVYIDADAVKPTMLNPGQVFRTDAGGHARFLIRPTRPGKIRICVVQRAGEEGLATWAAEIEVVKSPNVGDIWQTINGRHIKVGSNGTGKVVAPTKARAAGLAEFWNFIVSLFGGSSKTINATAASSGSVSLKAPAVLESAKVGIGQVTLDGTLSAELLPPAVVNGPCLSRLDAKLVASLCPTLVAQNGHAVVGLSADGTPMVAAGAGNVIARLVGNDGSSLVGNDGSSMISDAGNTLIGNDGSTLIGNDGGTLIGNDGSTLVGNDGSSLIGIDGSTLVGPNAPMVAAGAGNLTAAMASNAISIAPGQMVAAGAGNLVGLDGGTLVAAGGLN